MRIFLLALWIPLACQTDVVPDEGDCGIAGCSDTQSVQEPDGETLYNSACASCHGADGRGIEDEGPDIVHELHHTDEKLLDVILNGDGSMEPVDVSEEEAQLIIDYMRESWE